MSILGLFKFGIVGKTFDNLYRMLVGDSYPVLLIISIFVAAFVIATGRIPIMTPKRNFGLLLVYLGSLIILHGIFFSSMSLYHNYNLVTWNTLAADMTQVSVDNSVGGGMIGSYLYSFFMPMFSTVGTYFVTALIIFIGILMLFNVTMKQVSIVTTNVLVYFKHLAIKIKDAVTGKYGDYVDQKAVEKEKASRVKPEPVIERDDNKFKDVNSFAKKESEPSTDDSDFHIDMPKAPELKPNLPIRLLIVQLKLFQNLMELMELKIKICQNQLAPKRSILTIVTINCQDQTCSSKFHRLIKVQK